MMNKIFMSGPNVGKLEEEYVLDALRNGWYENKYYYVEKFEKDFASWHDRKYALMTPNCTTAIWLLLGGLGIGEGDEIIVPECTWIASVVSSHHLGAKLIFCDVDPHTWCLSPEKVKQRITKRTKAILAVNLYGNMADWDELEKIAGENSIYLIEDAAESLGSIYKGKRAGSFGTGSVFSFHNTKTITTGEGGMLLLDDKEIFDKCVRLRDLGRGPETKPYYNELIGFKFMPFNIQAALGLAQFERIEELVDQRRNIFNIYRENLKDLDVLFNYEDDQSFNCAWLTTIVIGREYNIDKNEFISRMEELGTPARPFFYPLSSLPPFDIDLSRENPVSYDISKRGVNLPSASNLTKEDIDIICKNIKTILYERRYND